MMNGDKNYNPMKYLYILITITLTFFASCQDPDPLTPSVSRDGINNFTAAFINDESEDNLFNSEIDHENRVITVVFPFNYPIGSTNVLEMSDLSRMRVKANLDDN